MEDQHKTRQEWFETFPEPYRSQAIENAGAWLYTCKESAREALIAGFSWPESPQGREYWSEFFKTLPE